MYTVTWTQNALDELTSCWLRSDAETRERISNAMVLVDRHLRANAPRLGESRADDDRVMFADPIGIEFHVSELDRLVTVTHAWTF